MRDLDVIDSELRLLAAVRRTVVELGGPLPSIKLVDELLDEHAAHSDLPSSRERPDRRAKH